MRVQIITLVDITKTDARRDADKKKYGQHSNYSTLLQTACLRVNMVPFETKCTAGSINQFGFGSKFRNRHNYWITTFDNEYTNSITVEELQQDFNLVPVVLGLDETAKIETPVFNTKDLETCNIIFQFVE